MAQSIFASRIQLHTGNSKTPRTQPIHLSRQRAAFTVAICAGLCLLAPGVATPAFAQSAEAAASAPSSAMPDASLAATAAPEAILRWTGSLPEAAGRSVELRFDLFQNQAGGVSLWSETQRVTVAADGKYTVLLGAATPEGLPAMLFSAGEARWLGVKLSGSNSADNSEANSAVTSAPRNLLAAAPYAFKSVDSASLGGRAASDYVTREDLQSAVSANSANPAFHPLTGGTVTGTGTANYVPLWTGALTQGNSEIYQSGSLVGINTTTPLTTLDVNGTLAARADLREQTLTAATSASGQTSPSIELIGNTYSSSAAASEPVTFAFKEEPLSNNTATPTGTLALLYGEGSSALTPALTGMYFNSNGTINFAPGQGFSMNNLTAATSTAAQNSGNLFFRSSAWSSSTSAAVTQTYNWKVVASGNNTASPTGTLELLTGSGPGGSAGSAANPSATGLSIAPTGVITFASAQTFPATTLETELNAVYPQLATANTFALGASFGGPISATASGSGLSAVTATGTTGAYGITATSDTGNAGRFGNASAPDATIYSLNAGSFDGSSIPVALNATTTGTSSIGAYGDGTLAGLTGASSSGLGVWAISGSITALPTITSSGVLADAGSPAFGNAGVFAYTGSSQSSSYTYEVGRFGVAGVWGDTTGNPTSDLDFSAAVMGTTDAYDGYGGAFIANSIATDALYAKNLSNGAGIYGTSLGSGTVSLPGGTGGSGGTGVIGFTPSPAEGQSGVFGRAYQASNTFSTVAAEGPVGFVAGVWGDSGEVNDGTGTYTAGVVGTGDDITAGVFENNSGHPTLSVTNLSSGSTGLFKALMASTPDGACGIGGGGNLSCTGQMKSLVSTGGGARKVETYAPQSAENWMEDYGTGVMERGVALVKIDPAFAETITADASYHIFLTPKGDSNGLYVINETPASFEVRESKGGTSSLTFDYKIVAKRRGYEAQRLVDVTERFNAEQKAALPMSGSAIRNTPRVAPQPHRDLIGNRPAVGNIKPGSSRTAASMRAPVVTTGRPKAEVTERTTPTQP